MEITSQLQGAFRDGTGNLQYVGFPIFNLTDGPLFAAVPSKPNVILHAVGTGVAGGDPDPDAGVITPTNGAIYFNLNSAKGACLSEAMAIAGGVNAYKACTIQFKCTSYFGISTYTETINFTPASPSDATYQSQAFATSGSDGAFTDLVSCVVGATQPADTIVLLDDINYTPYCTPGPG